ncbi:tetratricopeptide repeat protein [Leptolyngbya sp. CCY15150]|uniref:tetratricopeptide repeat protein n=1 Tax=Leptolyngbya sp. CCY15150 TaxID=2767772 RepID=UPI0019528233|nr:tetratricopeptide repeat protein [Leptolyngbya sp. CCY15150]
MPPLSSLLAVLTLTAATLPSSGSPATENPVLWQSPITGEMLNPVVEPPQAIHLDIKPFGQRPDLPLLPTSQGLGNLAPLLPQTGLKQDGTAALLDVEGQLEDGDEALPDSSLYDLYTFNGEAGQLIEIRLSSEAFDTYLILLSPDGERVAENDDSVEGLNSIIYIQLSETGQYSVIANAYNAMGRGRYRLTVAAISAEEYQRGQESARASAEANQLFQQGLEQFNRSQFREAITSWEQALEIVRAMDNRQGEGTVLNALGEAYRNLAQYQQAIDLYEEALAIAREIGNRRGEGSALTNLGSAYLHLSQYERAIDFYEQALVITRESGNRTVEGAILGNLGVAYRNLGQYERAIDFYEQALAISREISDRASEGADLTNLGNAYLSLGQYERTIDLLEQALTIFRELGVRAEEGTVLGNLGVAYRNLGQYERAIDFHEQHLIIAREIGDRAGEGRALGNLGIAYNSLGRYERAIDFYEQSLAIAREIGNRAGEGHALGNLGFAYRGLDQDDRALEQYGQALTLFNELGARAEEATALSYIGVLLNDQNQTELAIIFLKASVDVREAIRGDIRGLDTDLQQSFTDTVADDYRLLADLLLQQDRILEAQRVLDLLKVQELDEYLAGDIRRNAQTASGVAYLQPEQTILERYGQLQANAIALGQERARLNAQQRQAPLTPAQSQRLDELVSLEQDLARDFNSFVWSDDIQDLLAPLSPQVLRQTVDLEDLAALRNNLGELDAALIYPLVLEDRIELVITTANTEPLRRTVQIPRTQLNAAITRFRQALEDPRNDAQTPAQELYGWLIEPLEADLEAAGVTTLIYAPDASLRYIPPAAFHDGDQWLAQRFQVNHITAQSLQELTAQPFEAPRILAAAFADPSITYNIDGIPLQGLSFAGVEVTQLAAALPDRTVTLLDRAFDLNTVLRELGGINILHLATHGVMVEGEAQDSFILFGSGEAPTLADVATWSLEDIDLVVLSACDTGLGGFDNNGEQILGLGYQFQRRGAKAVIASLWQVSDQGTQVLMTAFYDALNQDMTKNAALQAAQMALITGDFTAVGGERGTASIVVLNSATGEAVTTDGSDLSHPYYWAPFILIGNGL